MGSDSVAHDESIQAQRYANALGTTHFSTLMNAENSLDILNKAVSSTGEPFGDFSIIPTYKVSMIAKEKVTVALSGDGGDELFFGYDRYRSVAKNHSLWNHPFWFRYLVRGMDKFFFNEKHFNECILSPCPSIAHKGLHERISQTRIYNLLPELSTINIPKSFNVFNYHNPLTQNELLYEMRKAEIYGMLQKTLTKVDRASMAHGLEVRVPFLKKSFLEKILKLNINYHKPIKGRKRILFNLLQKSYPSISPQKIKMGFSVSLSGWLKNNYYQPFWDTLINGNICQEIGIEKKVLEKMFKMHKMGKQDFKWPIFSLYSLALWIQNERKLIN
jgi:asparagine synthase (glutamine-hydrolysing)